jgi:hypothetical protein
MNRNVEQGLVRGGTTSIALNKEQQDEKEHQPRTINY